MNDYFVFQDKTFEFEKRKNVATKYSRTLWNDTSKYELIEDIRLIDNVLYSKGHQKSRRNTN